MKVGWLLKSRFSPETDRLILNKLIFRSSRAKKGGRRILIVEQTSEFVLRGKTGWAVRSDPDIGWFVGFVESGGNTFVFTCQIAGEQASGVEARRIVEALFAKARML